MPFIVSRFGSLLYCPSRFYTICLAKAMAFGQQAGNLCFRLNSLSAPQNEISLKKSRVIVAIGGRIGSKGWARLRHTMKEVVR